MIYIKKIQTSIRFQLILTTTKIILGFFHVPTSRISRDNHQTVIRRKKERRKKSNSFPDREQGKKKSIHLYPRCEKKIKRKSNGNAISTMLGKFEGNSSWDGFPAYQFSSSPAAPLPPSEQFHSNVECPPSSPPLHSEKIARESVFNAFLFFRETASLRRRFLEASR